MRKKEETAYGVIGLGRFGEALAIMLAQSGKEVIVVDRDESKIKEMRQYTECAFVTENLSAETLKEIGIQNCDVVVICIGEKADVSILITMSVIEMGVPRVIAKAFSPEQGAVLEKIGAEVVYPERDMALRLGKRLLSNSLLICLFVQQRGDPSAAGAGESAGEYGGRDADASQIPPQYHRHRKRRPYRDRGYAGLPPQAGRYHRGNRENRKY